ncbi:DHH family phosphoesterase [Caldicellulosiruptor morganii]|uniref:Cyclic-di-AMP phosphodiesterase n=1 Tax=Caldicellulosiruptor morganii TaxID=1387555 RepID=A0ABY7BK60_9FIRM|nr:DHH family phosphoesterase [Caldicellulosiruptor morganii]WAM33222.1 DHH family phosphoesterase [Caldicellulosiruptor morganii]
MKDKKVHFKFDFSVYQAGFVLSFIFNLVILYYNLRIGIICFSLIILLAVYNIRINRKKNKQLLEFIETLTLNIDTASKDTLIKFPLPILITEYSGDIIWYNQKFLEIAKNRKLIGKNLKDELPELYQAILDNKKVLENFEYQSHFYNVFITLVEVEGSKSEKRYLNLFYFIDITEHIELKKMFELQNVVIGYLMIDNYDDVLNSAPEVSKSNIASEIERRVIDWFYNQIRLDVFLMKYERDKYIFICNRETFYRMQERKFSILDQIKEVNLYNKIIPTISCGIGIREDSIFQAQKDAKTALDMALSRGGDQVVIFHSGKFEFFGGKTKEHEKRSKVRSRVMAQTIKEIVKHSDRVFIMGHQYFDLDCLGASVGLAKLCTGLNKEAYIVINTFNPTIKDFVDMLKSDSQYAGIIVDEQKVLKMKTKNSLLFVVDTQRISYVDIPDMILDFEKIIVIDHHRRAADWIEQALICYSETYASSVSELVAELLSYEGIKLKKLEAEILLAGIMIDTRGFTKNVGVRTFEVATYLRENDAMPENIKEYLKEDLDSYILKHQLISNTQILYGNIAVVIDYSQACRNNVIIAKVADELLNIKGIDASFVVCKIENTVVISARSNGRINVQLILEKIGGGGHLETAGCRLENMALDEAKNILFKAIDEYIAENQKN